MASLETLQSEPRAEGKVLDLSIIIPAYREAEALKLLLPVLKSNVAHLTASYEILIIDTQARLDETEQVCQEYGVTHIRRMGEAYGDAVRTGLRHACGTYILCMDADGSHNPAEIEKLWLKRGGFELIIGSRYVPGGHTQNPQVLILMSYLVNVIFRVVFGLRCRDVSNSFRLYKSSAIKRIVIASDNFDLLPEVLIKICHIYGPGSVLEVPITFEQRKKGESKRNLFLFALTYVGTIIRLKRITASKPLAEAPMPAPPNDRHNSASL